MTVAAGLALFLIVANTSAGRNDPTVAAWVVSGVICAAVCVPLGPRARCGRVDAEGRVLFATVEGFLTIPLIGPRLVPPLRAGAPDGGAATPRE